MERRSWTGTAVPVTLLLLTSLTLSFAAAKVVQVPTGTLPADSLKYLDTPLALFLHSLAGLLFGLLGPLQFLTAFRRRFGALHRLSGRVFAVSGAVLGLSGLNLLVNFYAPLDIVDATRGVFGAALIAALWVAIDRVRRGDIDGHRAWVIRAYAIGMGTAPVGLVFIPIYVVTGTPPIGFIADLIFVGTWVGTVVFGEWAIARSRRTRPLPGAARQSRSAQRPA